MKANPKGSTWMSHCKNKSNQRCKLRYVTFPDALKLHRNSSSPRHCYVHLDCRDWAWVLEHPYFPPHLTNFSFSLCWCQEAQIAECAGESDAWDGGGQSTVLVSIPIKLLQLVSPHVIAGIIAQPQRCGIIYLRFDSVRQHSLVIHFVFPRTPHAFLPMSRKVLTISEYRFA